MSNSFAIIVSDKVENVVICESLELCQSIFEGKEIIELNELNIGINWIRVDGKWLPPKPDIPDVVWHEPANGWLTPAELAQWWEWYRLDVEAGLIEP